MQASMMTSRQFQIEYGAAFLDAEGQVFRTEWVDRALLLRLPAEGLVVAGIDWARYRDYTALAVLQGAREGAKLLAVRRWHGLSWAEQVGAVAAHLRLLRPRAHPLRPHRRRRSRCWRPCSKSSPTRKALPSLRR
jgi:hypothetical protein